MRVGIVGGYGKMGKWFCKNLPHDVAIFGKAFKEEDFSKPYNLFYKVID